MDSSGVDRPKFELLEMERVVGSVINYYADDLGFMSTTALAEEIVAALKARSCLRLSGSERGPVLAQI